MFSLFFTWVTNEAAPYALKALIIPTFAGVVLDRFMICLARFVKEGNCKKFIILLRQWSLTFTILLV
ncbi:hypothetical protein RND71_042125 [Anisodus tanguticus]|uniref:Uncharacterized protein n=1 Tax=Anisodus tanguticus TaxID=243964 RepID=A0AAE1QRZ3_9SOLA|nr:hypothetical protein RND71_042125 [Anisodus tanguticus]